jgi:DNA-binding transcriptional LysR family regulator
LRYTLRQLAYFVAAGEAGSILKPTIQARIRQSDVLRGLVASGHGYGLANVRPLNQCSLDGKALVYIFLEEDLPAMTLGIATLKKAQFSPAQDTFIAYCGKSVSNDEIPGMTPPGLTSN